MGNAIAYLGCIIAVAAAVYKLATAPRRQRKGAVVYLAVAIGAVGVSVALLAPATLTLVSRVEPVPNLGRLAGNGVAMVAAWCVQSMLTHADAAPDQVRQRIRLHTLLLIVALAAMSVLLITAGTQFSVDFVSQYGHSVLVAGYEFIYLAYMAWGMAAFTGLVRRSIRAADRRDLRIGLWVTVVGATTGMTWALWKCAMTITTLIAANAVPIEGVVSIMLAGIAASLWGIGSTLTAWTSWWRNRQARHAIAGLWTALYEAMPSIALSSRAAGHALYRRVIEVRDGQLALRPHIPPGIAARAETLAHEAGQHDPDTIAATAEAAEIAGALTARRAGVRYGLPPDFQTSDSDDSQFDLAAEAAWLAQVSTAFTSSRVVAQIRDEVAAGLPGAAVPSDTGLSPA